MKTVYRSPTQALNPILFYALTAVLFPLSLSADKIILHQVAPGVIWIMLLLALFLSQDSLFQRDYQSGLLEQFLLQEFPLYFVSIIRLAVYALVYVLPLLLLVPIIAIAWQLSGKEMLYIEATLLCGLPCVIVLMSLLNAMTIGCNTRAALVPLLLLPLIMPIIIFSTGSAALVLEGVELFPYLLILSAISLISLALGPLAISFILKSHHY